MVGVYVSHISLHQALWGSNGQLDYADYVSLSQQNAFNLYRYGSSALFVEVLFYGSLAIALLYALGVAPRVTCWLFALTTYAIQERNPLAADAGRTLLVLIAFLLCLVDSSRYFSLQRVARTRRSGHLTTSLANMLHNSGRFLIAWQICMVYAWAAFYKLGGSEWRNGTALYYVLHLEKFTWFPSLSHAIASNGVLVALLTYFTIAFQGAFPFLMWNERLKPYLVLTGIMLHVGIAVVMGLVSFSLTMIIADLSLLSDRQWFSLIETVRVRVTSVLAVAALFVRSCARDASKPDGITRHA